MSPAPRITALLEDGPLGGTQREVDAVEGRPPKTIDVDQNGDSYRYTLSTWEQRGTTAKYSFLYRV